MSETRSDDSMMTMMESLKALNHFIDTWPSLDDYMNYIDMHPVAEPYYDKQGRSWYTSSDKQKYNRKHKGKGKGKKRRRR